jgi:NADH-quinone oxidoreductase subunit L
MGLVMTDIKRVLAYSTISQLGFMMLALGTGGVAIAIFHLFNHAFFKGLLFLGAGSINHATGTFNMNRMGGLRRLMPWTYITFLIASLSMVGIWPLAGFWSKDEILASSLEGNAILFWLAMITVFMTAFYMFRIVFLTFGGSYKGMGHPQESPRVMVWPMVFLGALAALSGLINVTGSFGEFLGHGETKGFIEGFFGILTHPLPWLSLAFAGGGILLAYAMYSARWLNPAQIRQLFNPLYVLFNRKYLMDDLFENAIARVLLLKGLFSGMHFFDSRIWDTGLNTVLIENAVVRRLFSGFKYFDEKAVDGAVDGVADGARSSGKILSKAQTGQLQAYGLFIAAGILVILVSVFIAR